MNRFAAAVLLLSTSLVFRGSLVAQPADGLLPGNLSGDTVISSVPFDPQRGISGGLPIQSDPYSAQGAPIPGGGTIISGPGTAGPIASPFPNEIIPYDSPLLSGQNFDSTKPFGPNNPPPTVNFVKQNRRDNGVVKPQEIPESRVLLDALNRQIQIWSPQTEILDNLTPETVIKMTVPFGIETQFLCRTGKAPQTATRNGQVLPATEPAYAVGILCWNIPVGKKRIFIPANGNLIPRIGYGYQQARGELLAALAIANVAASYEIRSSANTQLTVQNLIESEMKEMTFREDLSMDAIGLSFYLENIGRAWINGDGEETNLISLAEYELNRPVYWNRAESINRLVGLSYLTDRFHQEIKSGNTDPKLPDICNRIDSYLQTVHRRTLSGLNEAGLRETRFLSSEKIRSAADMLLVNGHILRWQLLVSSKFPINSQSLRRSVYHLALTLAQFYNPKTDKLERLSPKEIEAISVTLHALKLYVKKYTREESNEPQDTSTASE